MRILNLLLLFLTAEAKRQKRGRLKGGTKVNSASKYPSYVSILGYGRSHFCGGTILDEYTILSAAHCAPKIEKDKILYGTNKRGDKNDKNQDRFKIGIKSQNAIGSELPNHLWEKDVIVIKLKEPMKLGPTAKKVELGTYNEFIQHVLLAKKKCTVIGNGRTDVHRKYSDTLKEGKTQLAVHTSYDWHQCGPFKADATNCMLFLNTDNALIAQGDSGGPIFCDVNGRMKQFGVASWSMTDKKSKDVNDSSFAYATTFTPEIHRHLKKWNPNNHVPADFRGMDDVMQRYKTNPGSIKSAPGGGGSSRQSGTSKNYGTSQNYGSSQQSRSQQRFGSSQQTGRYQQTAKNHHAQQKPKRRCSYCPKKYGSQSNYGNTQQRSSFGNHQGGSQSYQPQQAHKTQYSGSSSKGYGTSRNYGSSQQSRPSNKWGSSHQTGSSQGQSSFSSNNKYNQQQNKYQQQRGGYQNKAFG